MPARYRTQLFVGRARAHDCFNLRPSQSADAAGSRRGLSGYTAAVPTTTGFPVHRTAIALVVLFLAGCAVTPGAGPGTTACLAGEATYACQVERYNNVAAQ